VGGVKSGKLNRRHDNKQKKNAHEDTGLPFEDGRTLGGRSAIKITGKRKGEAKRQVMMPVPKSHLKRKKVHQNNLGERLQRGRRDSSK